jgi:hypothetical protein
MRVSTSVRISKDIEKKARSHGFEDVLYYDSKSKKTGGVQDCSIFKQKPTKRTLILINGFLRMGKVLPKEHVFAVIDTSDKSNTDTLLQGLLGRICGYYSKRIYYYHNHNKATFFRELDDYFQFAEGKTVVPQKANNITGVAVKPINDCGYAAIPLYKNYGSPIKKSEKEIIQEMIEEELIGPAKLPEELFADLHQQWESVKNTMKKSTKMLKVHDLKGTTYNGNEDKLHSSIRANAPLYAMRGSGINKFILWKKNDTEYFLEYRVSSPWHPSQKPKTLATKDSVILTTGKEIFAPQASCPELEP